MDEFGMTHFTLSTPTFDLEKLKPASGLDCRLTGATIARLH